MQLHPVPGSNTGNALWGPDWPAARALWRLDPEVMHLNHGSFGAVPIPVLEEQERWRQRAEANPTGFFERDLPRLLEPVRDRIAGFVGADPAGLVLLPNVTTAIAAVLVSTALEPGEEVLITDHAYSGVRAAVEAACRAARAQVREVRIGLDILGDAAQVQATISAAISRRTRLAVLDHITSPTGAVLDVRTLVAGLHERGVTVAVDGAHAAGSVALDVGAVGADHYVGNLHKWCCAPRGAGFVAVGKGSRAAFRPAVVGSRWDEGFPAAMEWWGTADYSALLSAPSALDLLDGLGALRVREHGRRLATWGQGIVAAALGTVPPRLTHAAMTLAPLPPGIAGTRPEARGLREVIADRLAAEVVVVAFGGQGYIRLSAHVYNRPGDYERLAAGLPQLLGDAAGPATAAERPEPVG